MVAKKPEKTVITLPPLNIHTAALTLIGDTPLICHAWSQKSKEAMLAKQMKKAVPKKEAKDPERDFRESLYPHPEGGFGFPAVAFKAAAVGACRFVSGIPMTIARGAFHVVGDLVKIEGEPEMREDTVRNESGVADIRYRGEFKQWRAMIAVKFDADMLSIEQIANLFNRAGFSVGIGEWRPMSKESASGRFGMFHVASDAETQRHLR